jgi:hypothetical protein
MNKLKLLIHCLPIIVLASCGETKTIFRNNKVYKYVNNQGKGEKDKIIEYSVSEKFETKKLKDKIEYYQITGIELKNITAIDSTTLEGDTESPFYLGFENIYYTPEARSFASGKEFENKPFKYYYGKFALTAMTIPLKYRGGIGDETLNPPTFETGFNINFAPSYRFNWSFYDPNQKIFGNNLTNYSITLGGLLGLGTAGLKKASNAPGLLSDRTSATFTYGAIALLGFNTIGIGYSVGFDNVLGEGRDYWVYQNKVWHGITISVDIIK